MEIYYYGEPKYLDLILSQRQDIVCEPIRDKGKKMRIDIEHVRKIQEERMKINNVPIKQIEWYEDGKKVEMDSKIIEDFIYTGLNNTDFIISEMYKERR